MLGIEKKIAVITPFKNRAKLLEECVRSVVNQTFTEWEMYIIDDGSKPESVRVAKRLAKMDRRIKYIKRPDEQDPGASICRNLGLAAARAKYCVFLDSDDLLFENALETRFLEIEKRPSDDFFAANANVFYDSPGDCDLRWNVDTGEPYLQRFLRKDNVWCTSGPIWRVESVKQIGGWNAVLANHQDYELHLRALLSGLKGEFNSQSDHAVRISQNKHINISDDARQQLFERRIRAFRALLPLISDWLKKREAKTNQERYAFENFLWDNFITIFCNLPAAEFRQAVGDCFECGLINKGWASSLVTFSFMPIYKTRFGARLLSAFFPKKVRSLPRLQFWTKEGQRRQRELFS